MSVALVGGVSWAEFIFLTLGFFGWLGFMAASSLGQLWRPVWLIIPYGLSLAAACRVLEMMLFQGEVLSLRGFLVTAVYLLTVMLLSYRAAATKMMVTQYPWLYERAGPFGWREKSPG